MFFLGRFELHCFLVEVVPASLLSWSLSSPAHRVCTVPETPSVLANHGLFLFKKTLLCTVALLEGCRGAVLFGGAEGVAHIHVVLAPVVAPHPHTPSQTERAFLHGVR